MKKLIKLSLLLLALLGFAWVTRAQTPDTISEWPKKAYVNGMLETDYPFLCVKYDSTLNKSHVYSCYPHKMWLSINECEAVKTRRRIPVDVKGEHFTVTVSRKYYKHTYVF